MTDEYEPQRLFESPDAPPVLRALLVRAHEDVPSLAEKALLIRAATDWGSEVGRATSRRAPSTRWATRLVRHATKLSSVAVVGVGVGLGVGAGALYLASMQQRHAAQPTEVIRSDQPVVEEEGNPAPEVEQPKVNGFGTVGAEPMRALHPSPVARSSIRSHTRRKTPISPEPADDKSRSGTRIAAGIESRPNSGASPGARESRDPESRQFPSQARPVQNETAARVDSAPRDDARGAAAGTDETTLLRAARQSLARSPERTLALTAEHRRRYPHGILDQEREALAIDALVELGRYDEARARARVFDHAYPDSPYRARIGKAFVR